MKKLLLCSLLLTGITTQAVPLQRKKTRQLPQEYMLPQDVVQQQMSRAGHKPTAIQKRLICTTYMANGVHNDSIRYIYNNNVRGSVHTDFTSYYSMFSLSSTTAQQYIQCDTVERWYNSSAGGLQLAGSTIYSYNSQNMVIQTDDVYPWGFFRANAVYGTSNRLTEVTSTDTFGGTGLIPKRRMYVSYDGQGRRTMDSAHNLVANMPGYMRVYHYDTKGNMDTFSAYTYDNGWEISYRSVYTYDNANRILTQEDEADYGGGFTKMYRDSFAYAGTAVHPVYHKSEEWDNNSMVWIPTEILEYSLNANQLPSFYVIYRYNQQWDTVEMDTYGYDANGLLIHSNGFEYLGNGQFSQVPYDQSTLYYEEHDPTSVSNITGTGNTIALYPNPATDILNISSGGDAHTVRIVNINGQTTYAGSLAMGSTTVDVATWPAGNYWVVLSDDGGQTITTGAFVKQ